MKTYGIIFSAAIALALVSCDRINETDAPLQAEFEHSSDHVLVGEVVTFTDKSLGRPIKWNWHFEDAEVEESILTQPKVRWLDAGQKTVTLTVSDSKGTSEIVKEKLITVDYHKTVKAAFAYDKKQAFDNEPITFTNLSEGFPNNVTWTFTPSSEGEQVVSTELDPVIVFKPGVYTIKLEVSNPVVSDVMVEEDAFVVLDRFAVISDFTATNLTTYSGGNVHFSATSTGNVQGFEWTFENGVPSSSTEADPVVTYNTPGKHKVTLRTYNDKYENICEKEGFIKVIPDFKSMVFLLPFDGDVKDYGPYSIQPSVFSLGGLEISFEDGYRESVSQAIRFPGGTKAKSFAVLQMPDDKLEKVYPQSSDMTLSVWTKVSTISGNEAVFAQGHCPGFPDGVSNQIWGRFQSNHSFRVTAEKTGSSGNTSTVSDPRFDDGQWHHLAITYGRVSSGGTVKRELKIYIDGSAVGKTVSAADKDTFTTPYCIGCNLRLTNNALAPENMFTGLMDDYALYSKALTQEEVRILAGK